MAPSPDYVTAAVLRALWDPTRAPSGQPPVAGPLSLATASKEAEAFNYGLVASGWGHAEVKRKLQDRARKATASTLGEARDEHMWLGVAIDHKLRFKPHALQVAKKAAAQVTTRAAIESQVHLLGGGECDKSVVGPYPALR
ncbi:hypothetical protein OQA88_12444 [Cercophora sp. LCS_1]